LLAILALCALFAGPVQASKLKSDLALYVERIRAMYPEAEITGSFYDWRSVSQYRSNAGLHLGYDIALDAGRGVPAGWPGTVVDLVPWTDTEYGVAVQTANGYRVTYGHLYPAVAVGQYVSPGMVVGTVARNHVDIKVKDGTGGYLDFGMTYGVLDGTSPWLPGGAAGLLPPPPYESGPLPRGGGVDMESLYRRYKDASALYESRRIERDRVADLVQTLSRYIDRESAGLPEAEQQMLGYYRAADQKLMSDAQVEAISMQLKSRRERVNRLIYILIERQRILRERNADLATAQSQLNAARSALTGASPDAERMKTIEATASGMGTKAAAPPRNPSLEARAQKAKDRLADVQARFSQGRASKTDLDEARQANERMQLVLALWQHGDRVAASQLDW